MKIAIFTSRSNKPEPWLRPDIAAMKRANHETKMWFNGSNPQINLLNLARLMDWCDIAYFDWCMYPFQEACALMKRTCKIVVRARGLPFFSIKDKDFPWDVDLIVGHQLIGQRIKEVGAPTRFLHLPQGTDPSFFTMPKRRKYGKNLGMHSTTIRYRKRVYTSVQSFYDLLQHDSEWVFHLKGEWKRGFGKGWEGVQYTKPCTELMEDLGLLDKKDDKYFSSSLRLTPNVSREAWKSWLQTKDVFISNSMREGTHVSLAESMMCGCYPLVNCWRGADNYYPRDNIYKTQRELVDKILEWQDLKVKEKKQLSQEMREWAQERYNADDIADRMVQEFEIL